MAWRVRTDQDRAQSGTLRSQRRVWLALARRGASFLGGQLRAHWLLVVGLLAFGALVVAVAPARLARVLSEVDARLLGLMLPCLLGHYVLRALAWRVALRRLGVPLRVTRAVLLTLAGQALIFLPGGDLWRVPVLARMGPGGHDEGELASTVAFDDLVLLVLLTLALVPAVFQVPNLVFAVVWVLLGEAAAITLLSWPRAYAAAVGAAARVPPMRRFDAQPRHLGPAFWRIVSVRTLAASTLLNAGAAMLSFAALELALRAVHVSQVGFAQAAFTYSLGHVLAGFSLLPAGLGVYEGILTGSMALQGVEPASGAAAAIVYRGLNDVLMALLGLPLVVLLERAGRRGGPAAAA